MRIFLSYFISYKSCTILSSTLLCIIITTSFGICFGSYSADAVISTEVKGTISTNTTWSYSNSPYIVTGSIIIEQGVTLTIEPGVEILVNKGQYFKIEGYLIARGTENQHIIFSSNVENPDKDDWGGIYIRPTAGSVFDDHDDYLYGSVFDHTAIEYASTGLYVYETGIVVTNSFFDNNDHAVELRSTNNTSFKNNRFSNNKMGIGTSYNDHLKESCSYILYNKVTDNIFYHNEVSIQFANIYEQIANLNVTQNEFLYNKGVMRIYGNKNLIIKNLNLSNNLIDHNEMGILFYDIANPLDESDPGYQIIIRNNQMINNSGYTISLGKTEDLRFLIEENTFADNDGGILIKDRIFANDQVFRYNSVIRNKNGIVIDDITSRNSKRCYFLANTFFENSNGVFEIHEGAGYEIRDNNFINNNGYTAVSHVADNISLQQNYWGTDETSHIDSMIYDYRDLFELGNVEYEPILTDLNTAAPVTPPTGLVFTFINYTLDLAWEPGPEPDLIGYMVYYDTEPCHPYTGSDVVEGVSGIDVGNTLNTRLTLSNNDRPYFFVITAYDSSGDESWYSNEVRNIDDSDGDGTYDNKDLFPHDPTQSSDSDDDGYGDNITGSDPDAFPNDPTQWKDSDGDGYGDNMNGDNPDLFPLDRHEWEDFDNDGFGDIQDDFPCDPSASKDSDGDNYPDRWNIGMSEKDTTTGLKIDKYPHDPLKYNDEKNEVAYDGSLILLYIIISFVLIFNLMILISRRIKTEK